MADWLELAARFDKLAEVHLIPDPRYSHWSSWWTHPNNIPAVADKSNEDVELARALADFCRAMAAAPPPPGPPHGQKPPRRE